MLRLAFDFIITWRETRTRPNAYGETVNRKGQRNDFYRTKNCVYPWLDYKTVRGKIAIQEEKVSLRK